MVHFDFLRRRRKEIKESEMPTEYKFNKKYYKLRETQSNIIVKKRSK
jgi:hypothetical protein